MIDLDKIKIGDILKWQDGREYEYYKILNIINNNVRFEVIKGCNESINGGKMEVSLSVFNCCANLGNNPLIEG